MNSKVKSKKDALFLFAERLLRLSRFKGLGVTTGQVIDNEVKLITSLIKDGFVSPAADREAIRKTIISRLGQKIADDWIRRAGGHGVDCSNCCRFAECGAKTYAEQHENDDFLGPQETCENFIMQIDPSKKPEYQSCLMRLDRCYGITAVPDFAEADNLATSLIREFRENKGRIA